MDLRRQQQRKGAGGSPAAGPAGGRGAAAGVIYFVDIFGPRGPHSHPPWLVSRPRLSARQSTISSGYGPFTAFPRLSLSFSCSFSSAPGRPHRPALPRNRHGHQPHGAGAQCLTSQRLAGPGSRSPEPTGTPRPSGQLLPGWAPQDLAQLSCTETFLSPHKRNHWAST